MEGAVYTLTTRGLGTVWVGLSQRRKGIAGTGLRESQRSALLVICLPVGVFLIQQELVNQKDCPYMCAYKLVTVKFKWWGLQNKVENFIHKVSYRGKAFLVCVCWWGCSAQQEKIIQPM